MSPTSSEGRRRLRWWPAVVVLVLALAALAAIWLLPGPIRQWRVVRTLLVLLATGGGLLAWFVLLSRAPWRPRVAVGLLALLLAVGFPALVRVHGFTGDLVPILSWRWSDVSGDALRGQTTVEPYLQLSGDGSFPQFLGPGRDGRVPDPGLARDWERRPPRLLWKREVGPAWSGFAVSGGLAVTQEQRGPEEVVVAYRLSDGAPVWIHSDEAQFENAVGGVGPRATPTIGGGRVFTLGATGLLDALDVADGRLLWQRDIVADTGAEIPVYGFAGSPLWIDGLVVVSAGGPGGSLVAYEAGDGSVVWRGGDALASYSSPMVARLDGERQIVILNKRSLAGHHLDTGAVLWETPWEAPNPTAAQPLLLPGDRLLASAGYGVGSRMFRLAAGPGGGPTVDLLWENLHLKSKLSNYVVHDGHVYGLDDGILVCLDPATGERCWKRGRFGHGQMLLAGDLLLLLAESGEVVLIDPSPEELRELGRFEALDGKTWNTPALAGRHLLVRNARQAACYELPLEEDA